MTVRVRLFAGLRERAGWSERDVEAATVADVWAALDLGDEPAGLLYAVNKAYAERDRALADGDEVALIPPVSGGAFVLSDEPLSLDRVVDEVRDERAGAIATFTGTTRIESRGRAVEHLDYEAYEGMAEAVMAEIAAGPARALRAVRDRDPPSHRPRRDRRDVGRDRRLGAAPRRRARRVPGRDRRAEGACAALEERGLRRRRGMDRPRLVTTVDYNAPAVRPWSRSPTRDYNPIQPRARTGVGRLRKLFGPLIAGAIALAKWSFVLVKFGSIFIAVGAYALIWGWKFGIGVVFLILVHEIGHYIEAKREGLAPEAAGLHPVPRRVREVHARATRGRRRASRSPGPILGGVAALVCYLVGESQHSDLLLALAYFGFFLNLINLIPFGILDGGAVWRSARWLRLRRRARQGARRLRALLRRRPRCSDPRHGRVARPAEPAVTDDREDPRPPRARTSTASVEKIAAEFRRGLREGRTDRPAGGRALRLGARRRGQHALRGGARRRPAVRRGGLGGRHGRRRRRDGGRRTGAPRKAAACRSASTSSCRTSRARTRISTSTTRSTTSTRARSASCGRRKDS